VPNGDQTVKGKPIAAEHARAADPTKSKRPEVSLPYFTIAHRQRFRHAALFLEPGDRL